MIPKPKQVILPFRWESRAKLPQMIHTSVWSSVGSLAHSESLGRRRGHSVSVCFLITQGRLFGVLRNGVAKVLNLESLGSCSISANYERVTFDQYFPSPSLSLLIHKIARDLKNACCGAVDQMC